MNNETKDAIEDAIGNVIKGTADEQFSAFERSQLSETARSHARGLMKMFLCATITGVLVGVIIMYSVKNADSSAITLGLAITVLPIAGFYFLVTGRAMLKPEISEYSVFYGWKARGLGLAFLSLGVWCYYKILFNPG